MWPMKRSFLVALNQKQEQLQILAEGHQGKINRRDPTVNFDLRGLTVTI